MEVIAYLGQPQHIFATGCHRLLPQATNVPYADSLVQGRGNYEVLLKIIGEALSISMKGFSTSVEVYLGGCLTWSFFDIQRSQRAYV